MVRFGWIGTGLAAIVFAYGINTAINTQRVYDSIESGLRGADTIVDYAKKFTEPALNLIEEETGINLTLNRYSFAENDSRALQGINKGLGLVQLIAGLGIVAGICKKKN